MAEDNDVKVLYAFFRKDGDTAASFVRELSALSLAERKELADMVRAIA